MAGKMTMLDYVREAPAVARENIARSHELTASLVELVKARQPSRIVLVASGSSNNACRCALPFMRSCLGSALEVVVMTPFTCIYYPELLRADDAVVVVTQSGLSTNALEALDALRRRGMTAVCLTGNVGSDAREHADLVIDYGVGEELVGYVTKGVTTLAVYLMLFAIELSGRSKRLADVSAAIDVAEEAALQTQAFFDAHIKDLTSLSTVYLCGAGPTMGVACEAALKMGETVHVPSVAYEAEEFIHGPNLQLTPAYAAVFFDSGDAASKRLQLIWRATTEVTDRAYLVTSDAEFANDTHVLLLPALPTPETASLAYLPCAQMLSWCVSSQLGSVKQHPLLKRFKAVAAAKSEHFVNYDEDE